MLFYEIKYGNNEVGAEKLLLARAIVNSWEWVDVSKDGRGRIADLRTTILRCVRGDGRTTRFCGFAAMVSACWDTTLGDEASEFVRMGFLCDGFLALANSDVALFRSIEDLLAIGGALVRFASDAWCIRKVCWFQDVCMSFYCLMGCLLIAGDSYHLDGHAQLMRGACASECLGDGWRR